MPPKKAKGDNPLRTQRKIREPTPIRVGAAKISRASRPVCQNPACTEPDVQDGVCHGCGRVYDDSNIVSEIQFGESSQGAAVVQGSYVAADQGVARTLGGPLNMMGGENRDTRIKEANSTMIGWANFLGMGVINSVPQAVQIYKLATTANFVQGRRKDMVQACCLYSACRQQTQCKVMLIDFAEVIQVNVFKLGHTFKALHEAITITKNGHKPELVEHLIWRFTDKLEFGKDRDTVALDAVKIAQRMAKDWIAMGRRPSGVCGACVILAARMNNYRRTVMEVVYVVKVTTSTIQKRLNEFSRTPTAAVTIEDFLSNEFNIESAHDPPSFYEKQPGFEKKTRRKRKVKGLEHLELAEGEMPDYGNPNKRLRTVEPNSPDSLPPVELRYDADGFAIPPQPLRNQLDSEPADQQTSGQLHEQSVSSTSRPQELLIDPELMNAGVSDSSQQTASRSNQPTATPAESNLPSQPTSTQTGSTQVSSNQQQQISPQPSPSDPNSGQIESQTSSSSYDLVDQAIEDQSGTSMEKLVSEFGDHLDEEDDVIVAEEDDDDNEGQDGESREMSAEPRRKKGPDNRPIQVPERWLQSEDELESQITEMISDPLSQEHALAYAEASAITTERMLYFERTNPQKEISMEEIIGEEEFADDDEVQGCLLSPADIEAKEKLWVNENKEWLRKQQLREYEKRMAANQPPKAKRNRVKKPRIGEGQTSAASSPAEAAISVMKERAWSKKINYDAIRGMFEDRPTENSFLGSGATSRVTSRAGSIASSVPASPASSSGRATSNAPTATTPATSIMIEDDDEADNDDYDSDDEQEPEAEEGGEWGNLKKVLDQGDDDGDDPIDSGW